MVEPSWLKEVRPDSYLDFKDLVIMFGFKHKGALNAAIEKGCFPLHDKKRVWNNARSKRLWLVKTIRREIRRINAEEANGKDVLSVVSTNETHRKNEVSNIKT